MKNTGGNINVGNNLNGFKAYHSYPFILRMEKLSPAYKP